MYNVDRFYAIINPPQACIMAVGGAQDQVVLRDGKPINLSEISVTISADNRVYDGEVAGEFLAAFKRNFENPIKLIM